MNATNKTLIKISTIFYFVVAAFTLFYTVFFAAYAMIFRLMFTDTTFINDFYSNMYGMYGLYDENMINGMSGFMADYMTNFLVIYMLILAIVTLVLTVGLVLQGIFLIQKKNYTFCMVMAVVSTLIPVFGTAPGVMTLIALSHPQGRALFEQKTPPPIPPVLPTIPG